MRATPALCLLTLSLACRPVEDRWTSTAEICAEDLDPQALSEGCAAALDQDFRVDADAFDPASLEAVRAGLFVLLTREAGPVSTLEREDAVHRPLLRHLRRAERQTGLDDAGAAAYNLASAQVAAVVPARFAESDWRAAYDPDTEEVQVRVPFDDGPESAALLLFHEAMHGIAPAHVPCPEDRDDSCDRGWRGAYGLQAGYAELLLDRCDAEEEPESCASLTSAMVHGAARVLADR